MRRRRPVGAVVLAAGLGTRMRSSRAKVLHELDGQPLIAFPLQALKEIRVDPIVVIVGYQEDAVRAACAPYGTGFARQKEQRGTGHAVRMAAKEFRGFAGDVLLVNGDLPFVSVASYRALVEAHQRSGAAVSLLTAEIDVPTGFGRIVREGGEIVGIVEEKDATEEQRRLREVNVGLYCARAEFLFPALRRLRPSPVSGELYLTDIVEQARRAGLGISSAHADAAEGAQVSTLADLADHEKTFRRDRNRKFMLEGVTMLDPETVYIGRDVEIGPDVVLGPNVILAGRTRIGRGCRFDGTAQVMDSTLGEKVHVKLGVVMDRAEVGDGAMIGPFAQLRPESELGAGVHIGNFVETKKAKLGPGTKANHLAYLGDAVIGSETNIGAGTITCNYDGFHKHPTIIGDRVQVGSDTTLVAPLRVGDDAYIATASTVRKNVPPGVLFFNVRRDMERPGWVEARRLQESRKQQDSASASKPARTRKRKS